AARRAHRAEPQRPRVHGAADVPLRVGLRRAPRGRMHRAGARLARRPARSDGRCRAQPQLRGAPMNRRDLLKASFLLPLADLARADRAYAAGGTAARALFFYFPDGVLGASQNGEPSLWHCTGSETSFTLGQLLSPLQTWQGQCVFFNGLSMGPTDAGSHPGGAKKLLTAS